MKKSFVVPYVLVAGVVFLGVAMTLGIMAYKTRGREYYTWSSTDTGGRQTQPIIIGTRQSDGTLTLQFSEQDEQDWQLYKTKEWENHGRVPGLVEAEEARDAAVRQQTLLTVLSGASFLVGLVSLGVAWRRRRSSRDAFGSGTA